ncbi:hypothetical protein GCM10007414_33500 [Agarivorans gilvus]|jgi:hypothetical protein|uniref:Uncharacterized protein n=1 Tax=Agarivorans gilvus TaxID=680279 RepID=A0ABQ1I726_9ALTE|nr:hypothetical protein GCM10007414_33500 [Agarivorans gilvus]
MKSPFQIGIVLLLMVLVVLTYKLKRVGGSHDLSPVSSLQTNLSDSLAHQARLTQTEAHIKNN